MCETVRHSGGSRPNSVKVVVIWIVAFMAHSLGLFLMSARSNSVFEYSGVPLPESMPALVKHMHVELVVTGFVSGVLPGLVFSLGLPDRRWLHIGVYGGLTLVLGSLSAVLVGLEYGPSLISLVQIGASITGYIVGGLTGQLSYRLRALVTGVR